VITVIFNYVASKLFIFKGIAGISDSGKQH
jgi:hypothetical protein